MTEAINTAIENTTEIGNTASAVIGAQAPLTKEQRIAKIDEQIAKLQARRQDIIDGVVRQPAAKVEKPLPGVGATVTFTFGRNKGNRSPIDLTGEVLGVKPAGQTSDGKRTPAQIKVQVGTGFDSNVYVIYPAQIKE